MGVGLGLGKRAVRRRGSCRERSAIVGGKSASEASCGAIAGADSASRGRRRGASADEACIWHRRCYYANVIRIPARRRQDTNDGYGDHCAAQGIIDRPLRDLRAARAARRDVVRAMQGGGEARAPRAKACAPSSCRTRLAATDSGPSSGVFEPSPARARTDRAAASGAGGWGTYATLIAFGLAVCLTGYLAMGELEERVERARTIRWRCARRRRSGQETQTAPRRHRLRSTNPTRPRTSTRARQAISSGTGSAGTGGPEVARASRGRRATARHRVRRMSAPSRCRCRTQASRRPPAPAPREVRDAPEPVPDRQQLLAAALSRCERENAVVGLVLQGARAAPVLRRAVGRGAAMPGRRREQQHPLAGAPLQRSAPGRSDCRRQPSYLNESWTRAR